MLQNRKLVAILFALVIADYGTTLYASVTVPIKELNPIGPFLLSPAGIVIMILSLGLLYWLAGEKEYARFFKIMAFIVILSKIFVVGNNLLVLKGVSTWKK